MKYKALLSFMCLSVLSGDFALALKIPASAGPRPETPEQKLRAGHEKESFARSENSDGSKKSSAEMRGQSNTTPMVKTHFGASGELPEGMMPLDEALKEGKLGKYGPAVLALNNQAGFLLENGIYISGEEFLKASLKQRQQSSEPPAAGKSSAEAVTGRHFPAATASLDSGAVQTSSEKKS